MLYRNIFNLTFLTASLVFNCFFFVSCSGQKASPIVVKELNTDWKFRLAKKPDSLKISIDSKWYSATVPGTVHTDLLNNKKIEDPFYSDNEKRVQWIETCDWEYQTEFQASEEVLSKDNIDVLFNGLDTYADVYLNDSMIIQADNMFVPYQASIREIIKKGKNTLKIHFHSPVVRGLEKLSRNGYSVPAQNELAPKNLKSSVFTRKAPFHYGWDWGPRLVTSGIWRPVLLKGWNNARIEDVFIQQNYVDSTIAKLTCESSVLADKETAVSIRIAINGKEEVLKETKLKAGINKVYFDLAIDKPKLWWSRGLGEAYQYNITTSLISNGQIIDSLTRKTGVRSVQIVQEPDSVGESFYVKLNGVPVFMKGANYIPGDNFIPRVTNERYKKAIQAAVDGNMNMLRVWGGAIYENDIFYELCDENGILVWQDFMFACSMIPNDSTHLLNLKKEFEENIKRLRGHASVALYCGNNENMVGWYNWGWQKQYGYSDRDSIEILDAYRKVMYKILPEAIKTYDSLRFYWPSSPGSGYEYNELMNQTSGDIHDWGVWFSKASFESYEKSMGRFVSEYGVQSFPDMKTIKSFSSEKDWAIHSALFDYKQRSLMDWISPGMNGNGMIAEYVKMYYKMPGKFEDFVYVSQLMQAKGLKTAIEIHRRNMPICMGSLYWQLNDCWPTVSWAGMDYYFRWKAAHYAVRKANQDLLVSAVHDEKEVKVFLISDKLKPVDAELKLSLMDFSGNLVWSTNQKVSVKPNVSKVYFRENMKTIVGSRKKNEVVLNIQLVKNGKVLASNNLYFKEPKDLKLPSAQPKVKVKQLPEGYEITFTAAQLVKDMYLSTDKMEGFFTDNYFDILPNSEVKVHFNTKEKGDLQKELKIKSLNTIY